MWSASACGRRLQWHALHGLICGRCSSKLTTLTTVRPQRQPLTSKSALTEVGAVALHCHRHATACARLLLALLLRGQARRPAWHAQSLGLAAAGRQSCNCESSVLVCPSVSLGVLAIMTAPGRSGGYPAVCWCIRWPKLAVRRIHPSAASRQTPKTSMNLV